MIDDKKEKFYRKNELEPYFPEDEGKELAVSTVVKHKLHPDSTIGFVSRIAEDPLADATKALQEVTRRMQKNAGIEPQPTNAFFDPTAKVYYVEWSSAPPDDLDFFKSVTFPVVRRVNYSQLGQQLFNVQPLPMPKSSLFYLDYKYGETTEEIKEEYTIGASCEENSQSTSGTALEKSGWGSAIRTFFTRASTGVASIAKKIVKLAVEFINFSR